MKTAAKIKNSSKPKREMAIRGNGLTLFLPGGIGTANAAIQIMKKTNRFIFTPKINDSSTLFKINTPHFAGGNVSKNEIRMKIWKLMEREGIAAFPKPVYHRIPNFIGAEKAAQNLRSLPEYRRAKIIFCNPDSPQRPAREMTLKDGKILVMATPRLKHGFLVISPEAAAGKERFASTIKGAFQCGEETTAFPKPDLIVTGSVAVDKDGNRLGKGRGYGDREVKMINEKFGKVPVATTIHDVQLVGYAPSMPQDEKIDIVVTPTKIIRIEHDKR